MSTWCRAYTPCSKSNCTNWIWQDRLTPGTRCRRCGTMWATTSPSTGKGKGYGKPNNKAPRGPQTWLETPPGLSKVRPMKISKVQQEATELLAAAWTTLPEDTQSKLQAIGKARSTSTPRCVEDPHGGLAATSTRTGHQTDHSRAMH